MPKTVKPGSDVDIDVARLSMAIWERRRTVLGVTLAVGVGAYALASIMTPLYRAESRIIIESGQTIAASPEQQQRPTEGVLDELAITSQVEVIRSSDLLRQVAQDLDLASRAEFDPAAQPSALKDMLVLLGLSENPLDSSSDERVLQAFRDKLSVFRVQSSRVIAIEFSSEDPELAAAVPNAMASAYLARQSNAKLLSNAGATAWLEPEIAALRTRVREAEARVADFRSESDLFLVGDNDTLAAQQLAGLSNELSRVRAERADAEARAENVRTALAEGRDADSLSSVLQSDLISRLRERQIATQSEMADLSITLLDNHPRIRGLRSQLADLDGQIRSEIRKAQTSLEGDAAVARLREQEILRQLNELKATSTQAGIEEVDLRALEREASAERELLESYLGRYREAASRADPNALPADARIIAQATPPSEPFFPKKMPILIVALLTTLLLQAIFIMLSELMSGRALRPVDAQSGVPVDGLATASAAPVAVAAPYIAAADDHDDPHQDDGFVYAETYGYAAAADMTDDDAPSKAAPVHLPDPEPVHAVHMPLPLIAAPLPAAVAGNVEEDHLEDAAPADAFSVHAVANHLIARRREIVACVSPQGDEASAGAVMLSRALSESGRRALLIDLTASAIPTELMADSAHLPGITNLLCAEVSIAEAIHADRLSSADIIPQGNADPALAMRGAARMPMIVEALVNAYDAVILECGQTDIGALKRIAGNLDMTYVLSCTQMDEDVIAAQVEEFFAHGHHDVLLLSTGEHADTARADTAA